MDKQSAARRAARRTLACCMTWACATVAGHAMAATYAVVDLATLAQGTSTVVRGANAAGTAVGGGRLTSPVTAARGGLLFERTGVLRVNGLPDSDVTNVLGVNDVGLFVGASNGPTGVRAIVAPRGGASRELPPLPGDSASMAYAINNAGQAVGYSSGPGGERAVSWSATGQPAPLGAAVAGGSRAYAVNQRGDAAGVAGTSTARRATVWPAGGGSTQLAALAGFEASEAAWINAVGDVVGYSATAGDNRRATLWRATGAAVDLGMLPGGSLSQAFGINDAGEIVGSAGTAEALHAFVWTASAGMQDLNAMVTAPGLVLTKAVGVTNQGLIVAIGHEESPGGDSHDHEQPVRVVLLVPAGG